MPRLNNDAAANQTGVLLTTQIHNIYANPEGNSRKFESSAKSIRLLADNIAALGQLLPLLVLPNPHTEPTEDNPTPNNQPYKLVDGKRRHAALTMLADDGKAVDAKILVLPDMSAADAYLTSMMANDPSLRLDPSLIDQSYQIAERKLAGKTTKEISAEMHMSSGWVSQTSKLISLRAAIQKDIHEGKIPWTVARNLPDMTEEEQDKTLADIAAAGTGSATHIAESNRSKTKNKKKKEGAGRKAKSVDGSGKRPVTTKAALNVFEALAAEPGIDPETGKMLRESKAEETRRLLFKLLHKFLSGWLGQQALVNQVGKLL